MTALKHAYLSVKSEDSNSAIATGSETASTILHAKNFKKESEIAEETLNKRPEIAFEKDFLRWMLSDGAGAMLLQNQPNINGLSLKIEWLDILSFANEMEVCMYAGGDKVHNEFKGYKEFSQEEWLDKSLFVVKQDVKLLNANIADITVEKALRKILKKRKLKAIDIDWFLPHYSSQYFKNEVTRSLNNANFPIPQEKWFTNLSKCGNTGSASMYIMLEELFNSKKLKVGEKILCYVPESGRFSSSFMLLEVV
jgi:3-oxoacyl-[acyl-carrier-protein] synthase-3